MEKIGDCAFGNITSYINGDYDNAELHFKSISEIHSHAFYIDGIPEHDCNYIYTPTQEMANTISQFFNEKIISYFCCTPDS